MTGAGMPGPATLALIVVGAAIVAILIGWFAGRGRRGRGVVTGAISFAILGIGGLLLASHAPQRRAVADAPVSQPAQKAAPPLESLRKAPSVGAADFMMLWTLPASERVDFCVERMKHFAHDCRDAVAGMSDMHAPDLPPALHDQLAKAVRHDLLNRDTVDIAESALAASTAGHPDQMLSFPSPGGTDADFYWCSGANDDARYQYAVSDALALASRAGLKFPDGVVIGRVRVIRSDQRRDGNVMDGDGATAAARRMVDVIDGRTGHRYTSGEASGGKMLAFHVCG